MSVHRQNYQGPGRYRHYKGGEYEVLGLAIREESKEAGWVTEVVYRPLSPGSLLYGREEMFWTRVLSDFNAKLSELPDLPADDDGRIPRFRFVAPSSTRPDPSTEPEGEQ